MNGRERGARLREAIFKAYEEDQDVRHPNSYRPGEAGHECEFYLFSHFRWAVPLKRFEGRLLRLFQTGQREEPRIFSNLRRVGATIWDTDPVNPAKQIGISAMEGHSNGFLDGVGYDVPNSNAEFVVVECKTHSDKSFKELVRDGVAVAKPQHYAQMMIYLKEQKLEEALYFAVNKNDDDIYCEFVSYDEAYMKALDFKAEKIIFRQDAPSKISKKPEFYKCKMCDHAPVCHGTQLPERNCRTCIESRAERERDKFGNGVWRCHLHGKALTRDDQIAGCADHRYLPGLINGVVVGTEDGANPKITYALGEEKKTWVDAGPLGDRDPAPGSDPKRETEHAQ